MGEETQVRRWSRVAGAVLGGFVLVTAIPLWVTVRAVLQNGPVLPVGAWDGLWTTLRWMLGESLGCLAVIALARLISRRLLGGRRPLLVGVVLTVLGLLLAQWFGGDNSLGLPEYLYGVSQLLSSVCLPLTAGAWVVRSRVAAPPLAPGSREFEGVWESGQGVLLLERDTGFTLLRAAHQQPVSGHWQREPGEPVRLSLRVAAPTELGHGWQTTALDVEYGPDGSVALRLDEATAFTRRGAAAEVEHAGGFVGQLEVLES
ncbi:hypothetical protein [Streptacidiphilus sp. P02-A3a]|uniref:hypothetical protein n=1 Tax=Streptacidiphilus sp. P02-A3a TaxID=2704468 RepID=UPI0015FA1503|nr:hypothetical protein [Streptacidiphilus sp. P02-A3a]QMU72908.1 hypothetical protein GXP74_36335 [Streptacidiphilus sp. P02-A3a]